MLDREYLERKESLRMIKESFENFEKTVEDLEELNEEERKEIEDENLELKKQLSKIEDYSNKLEINNILPYARMLRDEALDRTIKGDVLTASRLNGIADTLETLFELKPLLAYKGYPKYSKEAFNNAKKQARQKLSVNRKYTFTEPSHMEKALKEVLGDKQGKRIAHIVYNYILKVKMDVSGTYLYFLLLALSSISNDEMIDRETIIGNLNKL